MFSLLDFVDGIFDNIWWVVVKSNVSSEYVNYVIIGWDPEIGRDYKIDWDDVKGTFWNKNGGAEILPFFEFIWSETFA